MAFVRICPVCNHPNPGDELYCCGSFEGETCGWSLDGVDLVELGDSAAGVEKPQTDPRTPVRTVREVGDDVACAPAVLECPWGEMVIAADGRIGRDPAFSPDADNFARYMTVSGVHARVFIAGEQWFVRDLDSTNGTFVNGVQVEPNHDTALRDGDQLNFSKGFRTVFRIGGTRR